MVYKKPNKQQVIHNSRGRFDDVAWGILQGGLRAQQNMCEIARSLNVHPGTLRYQLKFTVPPSERRAWRAPSVSPAKKRQMKTRRALVESLAQKKTVRDQKEKRKPFMRRTFSSPAAIRRELAAKHKINVSYTTIRRDLHSNGRRCRKRPKRVWLYEDDPRRRVTFCNRLLKNMKVDEMKKLMSSDEKFFDCNHHGDQFEWCLEDEHLITSPLSSTRRRFTFGAALESTSSGSSFTRRATRTDTSSSGLADPATMKCALTWTSRRRSAARSTLTVVSSRLSGSSRTAVLGFCRTARLVTLPL